MIIAHLAAGAMRFNALKRASGQVPQRTLTLKSFERDGLVSRTMYPTIPPRVDDGLAPLGHTLMGEILVLIDWSHACQDDVAAAHRAHDSGSALP